MTCASPDACRLAVVDGGNVVPIAGDQRRRERADAARQDGGDAPADRRPQQPDPVPDFEHHARRVSIVDFERCQRAPGGADAAKPLGAPVVVGARRHRSEQRKEPGRARDMSADPQILAHRGGEPDALRQLSRRHRVQR